jgi:hypothetical protein
MTLKIIKRIVYGVAAALFLLVGGKELLAAGLTLKAVLGLGGGAILGFAAATGAG